MTHPTRLTLHDVAHSLNIPLDQVTKVILGQPGINDDVRRSVFAALEQAGIVSMSRESASGTIGVAIPGAIVGDYIGEVVRGVTETAKARGYSVALNIETSAREDDLVRLLESSGCIGMVLVVPNAYEDTLALCEQYERDYVLIDHQGDDAPDDTLTVEARNRESIVNVMNLLFELGHTRIGFITGIMEVASARQRFQGYVDALEAANLPFDAALVREGDWQHPRAYALASELLDMPEPPSAIVAANDFSAFGAIQAARERGLSIGRDISITGFDDIDMAATVTPSLTTVRQPMFRMGEAAVDMLVRRSKGEKLAQRHIRLDTELMVRQSTGAARR